MKQKRRGGIGLIIVIPVWHRWSNAPRRSLEMAMVRVGHCSIVVASRTLQMFHISTRPQAQAQQKVKHRALSNSANNRAVTRNHILTPGLKSHLFSEPSEVRHSRGLFSNRKRIGPLITESGSNGLPFEVISIIPCLDNTLS